MKPHALILVDLQNDYFPGGRMELEGIEAAAANAARILQHYRSRALPVFHIRHIAARPGATFFLPDTPGSEIHPAVAPAASESVIVKHFPNSFRETDLLDRLRAAGVDSATICGAMSHMCIDATTRAAFDFGFTCRVAHDACATRALAFGSGTVPAAQVHASFMAALGAAYAQVLATADVLK
jgi:nicotinamidase-related amidase